VFQILNSRLRALDISFWSLGWRLWTGNWKESGCGIEEGLDALAVDRADRKDFVETEFREFEGIALGPVGVDFVDGDEDRFATSAEPDGSFAVEGDNAFLDVDNEQDDIGGFDGEFDLRQRRLSDDVIGLLAAEQADAAGVYEGEGLSAPFGFGAHAVAGDAGLVVDNGNAAPDNAVEQGGFTDVRAADDGDEAWHVYKVRVQSSKFKVQSWGARRWEKRDAQGVQSVQRMRKKS
jgi:hypothetical protein